jgi:hypothetical protein
VELVTTSLLVACLLILNLVLNSSNLKSVAQSLPFAATMFVDIFKAVWFTIHKNQVCNILAKLESFHPDTEEKQIKYGAKKFLKLFNIFQTIYLLTGVLMALVFTFNPLETKKNADGRQLAVDVWLPFDGYQDGIYEIVSVFLTFVSCSIMTLSTALFILIIVMILLVAKGFDYIKEDFKNTDNFKEAEKVEILKKLIERHVEMHDLVMQIGHLFAPIFLMKIVYISINICLIGFQLFTMDVSTTMLNYGLYLFVTLVRNFFLCYGSQQVIDLSQGIGDAIYEIKWYKIKDLQLRRDLLFIMVRAQKSSKFTAGKFSVVCMESFKFMINSSYSYFALLNTIYSK